MSVHLPVLADEVIQHLLPQPGQVIVDGTLGGGGHTQLLAERVVPGGRVIALDRDPAAVATARQQLSAADLPVTVLHANYMDLFEVLSDLEVPPVDAVLLDLGLSSDQLADPERGFSFDSHGPLDLRFDPGQGHPAGELVNRLDARQLADIIYRYGEERYSRRIARGILEARRAETIRTAQQLAQIVARSVPPAYRRGRLHPATRTFQALRIAVNDELGALQSALRAFPECIRPGGRLAVISFHSLEDRLVKEAFRDRDEYERLTRKPIRPSPAEVARNPRSRSARLRVAECAACE